MPKRNRGKCLKWRESRQTYEIVWYWRGKRRSHSCGTEDLGIAEEKLAEDLAGERPAGPCDPAERPIAQILSCYMTEHAPHVADPARIGYAVAALLPFWGRNVAGDVKGSTCRSYARHEAKQGRGDGTTRRNLTVLRAAINHDFAEGRLTRPVSVEMPDRPAPRDQWCDRAEIARLVRAARKMRRARDHLPHFILLGFYTAQRKGAILTLRKPQIDPETWLIDFRDGRQTNKGRPPIPAPRKLRTTLRGLMARTPDLGYLISYQGGPVKEILKGFTKAAHDAGLPDVTPHTLRHSAATHMVRQGVPMAKVSAWLGHRNTKTTEDVYAHHAPDYLDEARKAFE
jgi:integrase